MSGGAIQARGLGTTLTKNNNFTRHQILILQYIQLACASLSLIAGVTASFWFVRMRRTFRHRLIMLLILSDTFKALWYLTFPLVEYSSGQITQTASAWCQASGFLLTFANEAADFAILMIAVHAALYVFRTRASKGEAGLYKHRYIAYTCWLVFPTLMASLAFVNSGSGYNTSGTFCSLPVRPFWYRLALNWIPRYLILITIIMLYIAIYIFVHRKFTDFKKQSSCPDRDSDESINYPTTGRNQETTQEKDLNPIVPKRRSQTTSLARNGLLPTPEEGVAEWSDSYFVPTHQSRLQSTDGPRWEGYSFGGSQPVTPLSPTDYAGTPVVVSRSQPEDHHDTPANTPGEAHRHLSLATITTSHTTYNMMQALRSSRMNSMAPTVINSSRVASILKVKTEAVPPDSAFMDTFSPFSVTVRGGQGLPARPTLVQRHRDIKRKLRLLFIYPLVYMLMWLIPFISHCLQYSDSYSKSPSYLLAFFVVGSLGLQGTVDSILFSTREKPWRHLNRHRFFGWGFELSKRKIKGESRFGKDTVVQVAEADLARDRKGDEEEALKVERLPVVAKRPGLARERSWWEVEGRMRMDSVMLGTDRTNMDQVGEQRDLHEDVIREEDVPPMEPDHDAPSKELRFAPEPGRSK